MLMRKKIVMALATLGISSLSILANAATDLTVTNNTNEDSTSIVVNGSNKCSNQYGEDGITRKSSTHTIPAMLIRLACGAHLSDCYAHVYMSADCSGESVASVVYDLKSTNGGVKSITSTSSKYLITGTGYHLTLDYSQG